MAKAKGTKKPVAMSAAEKSAMEALAAFVKKHEGKDLTDAQKAEKKELHAKLGALKFVRIASKRGGAAVKAIRGLKNLAGKGYTKTPEQVKFLVDGLRDEVKALENALSGTTAKGAVVFQIPDAQ